MHRATNEPPILTSTCPRSLAEEQLKHTHARARARVCNVQLCSICNNNEEHVAGRAHTQYHNKRRSTRTRTRSRKDAVNRGPKGAKRNARPARSLFRSLESERYATVACRRRRVGDNAGPTSCAYYMQKAAHVRSRFTAKSLPYIFYSSTPARHAYRAFWARPRQTDNS